MRIAIELAVIRARLKRQRSESYADPVPTAADVVRELREDPTLYEANASDVRFLCARMKIKLADGSPGDSQRPPRRDSISPPGYVPST